MLNSFPLYHWFHNGNPYSGAEGGMRYILNPGKRADPVDESGKKKMEYLTATVWPGPWSMEHTAEEKLQSEEFAGNQDGLDAAVAWLKERYDTERERWDNVPNMMDCEPDR